MLTVYWWSVLTTVFFFFFHRCCFLWISPGMCFELTFFIQFSCILGRLRFFFKTLILASFCLSFREQQGWGRYTSHVRRTLSPLRSLWCEIQASLISLETEQSAVLDLMGTQYPIPGTSCLEYSIIGDNFWRKRGSFFFRLVMWKDVESTLCWLFFSWIGWPKRLLSLLLREAYIYVLSGR